MGLATHTGFAPGSAKLHYWWNQKKYNLVSICHISLLVKRNSRGVWGQHEFHLLTEPILLTKTALELCLCLTTVAKFLSTDKAGFPGPRAWALPLQTLEQPESLSLSCLSHDSSVPWLPYPFQRGELTSDGSIQERTFHTKDFISQFVSAKCHPSCNFAN